MYRLLTSPTQQKNLQYACHHCRIVQSGSSRTATIPHCLNCGGVMHNMGAGFIPPHHSDKNQWQKVELLVKHDFAFEFLPS